METHRAPDWPPLPQTQRLHIAFVADCLDGELGGGVISARRFVQRLQRDHEVWVIGTAEGEQRITLPPLRLPSRRLRDMRFVIARPERTRIRSAFQQADIVHLQYPFWLSFVALDEARRMGKPVVAALHVQPENVLYNIGVRSKRLNRALFRWWVRHYYDLADTVICPTPFGEQILREHGLSVPTVVISNGYSPDLRERAYEREPQHRGHFLILMVGRFAAEKRQDVLIRAVSKSRYKDHIKVVLSGAGPLEARIRRMGEQLPHPPEIGYQPHDRLERLLNTADLFVHCSEVELEGMSVLDAMSVGLPALVAQSPQSAASQFALDSHFAFPAGDATALAQRIDTLIEQPQRLSQARAVARTVARSFAIDDSVGRLVSLYQSLVPER